MAVLSEDLSGRESSTAEVRLFSAATNSFVAAASGSSIQR